MMLVKGLEIGVIAFVAVFSFSFCVGLVVCAAMAVGKIIRRCDEK